MTPHVSELGDGGAAGPGVVVDLIKPVLAWPDGGKSGFGELAAEPGEHVGDGGLGHWCGTTGLAGVAG
jgi:hypothetical protein